MAVNRLTKVMVLAINVVIAVPILSGAQETTGGPPPFLNRIGVNGWDLKVSANRDDTDVNKICTLSTTILANPEAGSSGGRVTVQLDYVSYQPIVKAEITGGIDAGQPIEMWVDRHLIADQRSNTGTASFKGKSARNLVTLYKAGFSGSVRFSRNGKPFDVPLSLSGFTRAVHTIRQKCSPQ